MNWKSLEKRPELLSGLTAGLISLVVYVYTAQPNVGLLDSGEFLVAAIHFGVPHPPGYPLWSILAWLFQLLPLGNAAWEVNVFSGVCGALTVGFGSALLCHCIRWFFFDEAESNPKDESEDSAGFIEVSPFTPVIISVAVSLSYAFSISMWTQAVITEVYTLHSLIVVLYMASLYMFIRQPEKVRWLVFANFFFWLGMSNQHLILPLILLLPIPVLLRRISLVIEFGIFLAFAASLTYIVFAALSADPVTYITARRFFYCCLAAMGFLFLFRRKETQWRLSPLLALGIAFGLAPHLYMPFASSTNPPMNWGVASEIDGLFYSINRSQYHGSLSDVIVKLGGTFMGTKQEKPSPVQVADDDHSYSEFTTLWLIKAATSFSPIGALCFFVAFMVIFKVGPPQRAWLFTLYIALFLSAFLQAILQKARADLGGWLLQMPYHTHSFWIFSLLIGIGATWLFLELRSRYPSIPDRASLLFMLLPVYTIFVNIDEGSQRNHWFGWQYGYDMLNDLPENAILYGGTDPGRFVPTYMIFGESTLPPSVQRKPFDRRDLYIITQNALADRFYMQYIRGHYGEDRPDEFSTFELWLERDKAYPEDRLHLPNDDDAVEMLTAKSEEIMKNLRPGENPLHNSSLLNGVVAEWIWNKNKHKHAFFIEESFRMEWSYPYATPHGLIYQVHPEPVELTDEMLDEDYQFWDNYINELIANPHFHHDIDAKRSYAKLRNTMGNICSWRSEQAKKANNLSESARFQRHAERIYKQCFRIWDMNVEALQGIILIRQEQRRIDEIIPLIEDLLSRDPHNRNLRTMLQRSHLQKVFREQITQFKTALEENPDNIDLVLKTIENYLALQDYEEGDKFVKSKEEFAHKHPIVLQTMINYYVIQRRFPEALVLARAWAEIDPTNPNVQFVIAKFVFGTKGLSEEFFVEARKAIELGDLSIRERFTTDPIFRPVLKDPKFLQLVRPTAERFGPAGF